MPSRVRSAFEDGLKFSIHVGNLLECTRLRALLGSLHALPRLEVIYPASTVRRAASPRLQFR